MLRVLTHTQRAGDVRGVAPLAHTAVGAQRVDALAVLTQVPHHTTLVYVCSGGERDRRMAAVRFRHRILLLQGDELLG